MRHSLDVPGFAKDVDTKTDDCNSFRMSGCPSNEVEVELRPFKHQVGGHTCVLEVTRSTICKPFIQREAWFYENEPDELKDFTPKYLGETFVTCDIQDDRKCLIARVPEEIITRDGLSRTEPVYDFSLQNTNKHNPKKRRKRTHSDAKGSLEAWSSICIDRQIKRYGFWANNQPQKFIILENLVHDYKHPCLMDLKMGRRQFGEDSNEEKRKLLESRCACSTSATLGFRISGSQAYKTISESYTFHDKYFGRNLDKDGAVKEIEQFFHNGVNLRTDVIRLILNKLENLQSVLLSQTDLFFHSASLLLLYDGAIPECSSVNECNCDSVQYDNYNSNRKCSLDGKTTLSGMEMKSLSGKDKHCMRRDDEKRTNSCSTSDRNILSDKCPDQNADAVTVKECRCGNFTGGPKFDVRVIDFAHVSERYADENEVENIADDTIVFGLIKLKDILKTFI